MTLVISTQRERGARVAALTFGSLIAAGALVHFYRLGAQSLWLDELWTLAMTEPHQGLRDWMDEWILPDVHPPLYFFLMRLWRLFSGTEEWALRLSSTIPSLLAIGVVPLVQRWTPIVRRPLALTALLATSTGAILYGQELRGYALLFLLSTAVTCLAVAVARRIEGGDDISGGLLWLSVVAVAAEYEHYFGLFHAAGTFAALFLFALLHGNRRALVTVTAAGTGTFAAFLPWLAIHVPYMTGRLGGQFWITNNWTEIFHTFARFAAGGTNVLMTLVLVILGTLALRPSSLRRSEYFVPLVGACVAALVAAAVSLHSPLITARNLLIVVPSFYIVLTAAFADIEDLGEGRYRLALRLLPAVTAAVFLSLTANWLATEVKQQWRAAAQFVAGLPGCETGILPVNDFPKEAYAHYMPPGYIDQMVEVEVSKDKDLPFLGSELMDQSCPLLLWTGHTLGEPVIAHWLERLDIDRRDVVVQTFVGHAIVLRKADIDRMEGLDPAVRQRTARG